MKPLLLCIMFLMWHSRSQAQEFFGELLSPQAPSWVLRGSAEKGATVSQEKFMIQAPVWSDSGDSVSATWKWSQLDLDETSRLSTGGEIPSHFYDSEFGFGYKHFENQNRFWGLTSSMGSAGDQIFHSRTKTVWNVTAFYSDSDDPTSRWIWLVNDSNNRTFLNGIPIPGAAYVYRPSQDFIGVFGFPFVFMRWKINDLWSSQFLLGPYIYKAEFSRVITGPVQMSLSADHSVQSYYREARVEDEDRVFYAESRALIGLKSPIHKMVMAEAFAGAAVNRSIVERKNYSGYTSDTVNLKNRGLLGLQISARF